MSLGIPTSEAIVFGDEDALGLPIGEDLAFVPRKNLGLPISEQLSIPDLDHLGMPHAEAMLFFPTSNLGLPLSEALTIGVPAYLGLPVQESHNPIPKRSLGLPVYENLIFVTGLYPHLDLQTLCPEFPVVTRYGLNVLQNQQESGRSFRRLRNEQRMRGYDLTWRSMSPCEFEALKALVLQVKGEADLFTAIIPLETQPRVFRFDEPAFVPRQKTATTYEVTIRLLEARSANLGE